MGLLGFIKEEITEDDVRPGDHIYTGRKKKWYFPTYYHHGIYVGDNGDKKGGKKVIHFTKVSGSANPARREDKCDHYQDTTTDDRSGVRMCCLHECFVQGRSLYIFEYGAGFWAIVRATRSSRDCDDAETVIKRANKLLSEDNFGEYSLPLKNCETFAYFCKTGDKFHLSKQVLRTIFLGIGGAVIMS